MTHVSCKSVTLVRQMLAILHSGDRKKNSYCRMSFLSEIRKVILSAFGFDAQT